MSDATPSPIEIGSGLSQEERLFAAACHFAGLPIFTAFGLANLVAPLVIWLVKKDTMPFVNEHGKESLNFQLTLLIAYSVSALLICFYIGILLIGALLIAQIVFPLLAGIAAYDGKTYKYPLTLRMVK